MGLEPGTPAADAGIADGDTITDSTGGRWISRGPDPARTGREPGDSAEIRWVDPVGSRIEATVVLAVGTGRLRRCPPSLSRPRGRRRSRRHRAAEDALSKRRVPPGTIELAPVEDVDPDCERLRPLRCRDPL